MPETRGIRESFREKMVLGGVPPDLPGKLGRWAKEFQQPGREVQGHRILNRFAFRCIVDYNLSAGGDKYRPHDIGIIGSGFIGIGVNIHNIAVKSYGSRRVGEIVASVGESLNWLENRKLATTCAVYDAGMLTLQFWRLAGNRLKEFAAIQVAATLLKNAGLVKVTSERKAGILADTNWRGFSVQLPVGVGYSPRVLFLALTVFKLAVLKPELVEGGFEYPAKEKILNLLAYFQHRDDDARTAYRSLLLLGWPPNAGDTIQRLWQLVPSPDATRAPIEWLPGFVKPSAASVRETYRQRCEWQIPQLQIPKHRSKVMWMPAVMPMGRNEFLDLMEVCADFWTSAQKIGSASSALCAPGLTKDIIAEMRKILGPKIDLVASAGWGINPECWADYNRATIRKALLLVPGIALKPGDVKQVDKKDISSGLAELIKAEKKAKQKRQSIVMV